MKWEELDDYTKWYMHAYEQRYGKAQKEIPKGFELFNPEIKRYWNKEYSIGVLELGRKFIGIACLAAKKITDRENFVRRFGLTFESDVRWRGISGLLEHLSRSPVFKAVLITIPKPPFRLEVDIPEKIRGRMNWARRNFEFHREKAESLKRQIESQSVPGGPFPSWLPKQMKEEEKHARHFLQIVKKFETKFWEHFKQHFHIKENLFAVTLLFYVYTEPKDDFALAVEEIKARKYSAKMEVAKTYFTECSEVKDPFIVFNPEFYPLAEEARKYYCLALSKDVAGFNSDKDVALAFQKMFTIALDLPTEEEIVEQIHVPSDEVSREGDRRAFIGYVVKSVVKNEVTKRRVYFPLDVLTGHAIIFGKTRAGKSFLSMILAEEAAKHGINVKVFDPHGTLADRLRQGENLEVIFTGGRANITDELQRIYDEASRWPETNRLRLLIILDETRLLKASNLIYCLNELGKRGIGFVLVTQYSTSIPAEARNVGTYFIMAAMSEREIQRFKDVTLHPSSKLITRLPRAMSFVFSPYWYPEPFFVRHKTISKNKK